MKKFKILIICFFLLQTLKAQEFQAKITVNASRVNTTIDRRIFTTLQNQLSNFFNNRKWTNDVYKANEKIDCNIVLNIENILEPNVYKAQLLIQSARPVMSSTYQAALFNFQDIDVAFKYIEYQPIEFNENRVAGSDASISNLPAIFAFYANMILGLHYDSFSPKGGEKYFLKAMNIVNNAPEGKNITGWRVFDGLRNRYWLGENLSNTRNNILHSVVYDFYRNGYDYMVADEKQAINSFLKSLQQLKTFNQEFPNSMFVQFFMQNKMQEMINIFKRGTSTEKSSAIELLSNLDPANAGKYNEGLQ
ncbi:MAG: DUF4835 family protein [Chitinophagaceae bacterium]|nr:DUF4835 family protein [Chitinophagaceae bacterium]